MNPETQNTINKPVGVSTEEPHKKERESQDLDKDSLICEEEYQAASDQETKNEQNISSQPIESLINGTKNI